MDFSEDNILVKSVQKNFKLSYTIGKIKDFHTGFGFLGTLEKSAMVFLGIVVMAITKGGLGTIILGAIGAWVVIFILLSVLELVFKIKSDRGNKALVKKYTPIRNDYIEKKASEIGCTSSDANTTDLNKKEWDLPTKSGYIKGLYYLYTYIHSSQDNYGDILIKQIPMKDGTVNSIALSEMDKCYKEEGYSQLDVGVSDFNNRYRVYTKDMVKARTYFSATLIQSLIKYPINYDYKVLGNNIYVEWNPRTVVYELDHFLISLPEPLITTEMSFYGFDISHYFEEVDLYFQNMVSFKDAIENVDDPIFK